MNEILIFFTFFDKLTILLNRYEIKTVMINSFLNNRFFNFLNESVFLINFKKYYYELRNKEKCD